MEAGTCLLSLQQMLVVGTVSCPKVTHIALAPNSMEDCLLKTFRKNLEEKIMLLVNRQVPLLSAAYVICILSFKFHTGPRRGTCSSNLGDEETKTWGVPVTGPMPHCQ